MDINWLHIGVSSVISFLLGVIASYFGSLLFHKLIVSKRPKGDYVSVDCSIGGNKVTMTYSKDVLDYKNKRKKPPEVKVLEELLKLISGD
jgi:hypothetical protein